MGAATSMTSKGQLTIPKDVRVAIDLPADTKFHVSAVNGRVVAVPKNKSVADVVDVAVMLGLPPSGGVLSMREFAEAHADDLALDDRRVVKEWNELQDKPKTGTKVE